MSFWYGFGTPQDEGQTIATVPAVSNWRTNAHLIFDAYMLKYVHGDVIDLTYGEHGVFWSLLYPDPSAPFPPGITSFTFNQNQWDFREFPPATARRGKRKWDTVVFDPPYKLTGTPHIMAERYGLKPDTSTGARMKLIADGFKQACLLLGSKGHLLAKCQDQVCSGRMHWQTDMLTRIAEDDFGLRKADRFDMIGHDIPQPGGRKQVHARGRGSTLLVFTTKGKG